MAIDANEAATFTKHVVPHSNGNSTGDRLLQKLPPLPAICLVNAVTNTRSPRAPLVLHSCTMSDTCPSEGRMSTGGSVMPVGRMTAWASTRPPISSHPNPPLSPVPRVASSSSNFPGVAETKIDLLTLDQNSPAWTHASACTQRVGGISLQTTI